jgi:hypothetical protein
VLACPRHVSPDAHPEKRVQVFPLRDDRAAEARSAEVRLAIQTRRAADLAHRVRVEGDGAARSALGRVGPFGGLDAATAPAARGAAGRGEALACAGADPAGLEQRATGAGADARADDVAVVAVGSRDALQRAPAGLARRDGPAEGLGAHAGERHAHRGAAGRDAVEAPARRGAVEAHAPSADRREQVVELRRGDDGQPLDAAGRGLEDDPRRGDVVRGRADEERAARRGHVLGDEVVDGDRAPGGRACGVGAAHRQQRRDEHDRGQPSRTRGSRPRLEPALVGSDDDGGERRVGDGRAHRATVVHHRTRRRQGQAPAWR